MTGQEISAAWKEWIESPVGRRCAEDVARGKYLRNRLEFAFLAGIETAESLRPANKNVDEVVAKLRESCYGTPAKIPWPHRVLHDAIELIEALVLRPDAWVRCADRLPEPGKSVLIWRYGFSAPGQRNEFAVVAFLDMDDEETWWQDWAGNDISKGVVTHWQALPSPPEDKA